MDRARWDMSWGLSLRARQSIKTGLAMAIAIGLSLRMDFGEPHWAGFAVAMISLDAAGQSLNKAAMRMLGTLVAFVTSLSFIALFPQQRWGMLLALTPYIGFCTYMIAGRRRQYFWYVCAFVCLIIMTSAGVESANAFRVAVARVEETALGILVYSLVDLFLWPHNSRSDLESASRALADVHVELLRRYRDLLVGRGRLEDSSALPGQQAQCLARLGGALNAAETDTFAVWEARHAWRRLVQQSTALVGVLGRWRVSIPEIRSLALDRLVPGLEASFDEIVRRFEQIQSILGGSEPEASPAALDLGWVRSEVDALAQFERAALALFLDQLRALDETSRALLEVVVEIEGSGEIRSKPLPRADRAAPLALDPDRFEKSVTAVATLWVSFAVWIWLDPPGGQSFWQICTLLAMASALGGLSLRSIWPGILLGIVAGGVAYIGIMPHLSGYAELGLLFFGMTAGGFYLLWDPPRRLARTLFVAFLLSFSSLSNEQSYSFVRFANTVAATLLALGLGIAVAAVVPSSPRSEKVFLRLLSRFFRHAEILMSSLAPESERAKGPVARWQQAWYRNDLLELPRKLESLIAQIDYRLLPGTDRDQVGELVTMLRSLAFRIQELVEARRDVSPDPRLEELVGDIREWRLVVQEQFRQWARDPAAVLAPAADMSERLHLRLTHMERRLDDARTRGRDLGGGGLHVDYQKLYRYLGAFRSVSECGIDYARASAEVDWQPWREARF